MAIMGPYVGSFEQDGRKYTSVLTSHTASSADIAAMSAIGYTHEQDVRSGETWYQWYSKPLTTNGAPLPAEPVPLPPASLTFITAAADTMELLQGTRITTQGTYWYTKQDGTVTIPGTPQGVHDFTMEKAGFETHTASVNVNKAEFYKHVYLHRLPTAPTPTEPIVPELPELHQIIGTVTDSAFGTPIPFVTVCFPAKCATTGADGKYAIINPEKISAEITANISQYVTHAEWITAPVSGTLVHNISLGTIAAPPAPLPPTEPPAEVPFWERIDNIIDGILQGIYDFRKEGLLGDLNEFLQKIAPYIAEPLVFTDPDTGEIHTTWIIMPGAAVKKVIPKATTAVAAKIGATIESEGLDKIAAMLTKHPRVILNALRKKPTATRDVFLSNLKNTPEGAPLYKKIVTEAIKDIEATTSKTWFGHLLTGLPEVSKVFMLAWIFEVGIIGYIGRGLGMVDPLYSNRLKEAEINANTAAKMLNDVGFTCDFEQFELAKQNMARAQQELEDLYIYVLKHPLSEDKVVILGTFLKTQMGFESGAINEDNAHALRVLIDSLNIRVQGIYEGIFAKCPLLLPPEIAPPPPEPPFVPPIVPPGEPPIVEPPVGPPAVSSDKGLIYIDALPALVDVYIGGRKYGTTDANGIFSLALEPGTYEVRLSKPGYMDATTTVYLSAAETERISFELTEHLITTEMGRLEVRANLPGVLIKSGAEVLGETGAFGKFDMELASGTYDISMFLEGKIPIERRAYISNGKVTVLAVTMKDIITAKKAYKVSISVTDSAGSPLNAKILVNGVFTGKWAPDYVILNPGTYTIGVLKSGYYPAEQPITLEEIV